MPAPRPGQGFSEVAGSLAPLILSLSKNGDVGE